MLLAAIEVIKMKSTVLIANILSTTTKLAFNSFLMGINAMLGAGPSWKELLCDDGDKACYENLNTTVPLGVIGSANLIGRYLKNQFTDLDTSNKELQTFNQPRITYLLSLANMVITGMLVENMSADFNDDHARLRKGMLMGLIFTVLDEGELYLLKYLQTKSSQATRGQYIPVHTHQDSYSDESEHISLRQVR